MGTKIYICGCGIQRSMYEPNKILAVTTCMWHYHLYDENKTPKILAQEIQEVDRTNPLCWCLCHFPNYINVIPQCNNCGHPVKIYKLKEGVWVQ